jgi:hypothetical protein
VGAGARAGRLAFPAAAQLKLVDVAEDSPSILLFFFGFVRVAQYGRSKVCTSVATSLSQLPKRIAIALLGYAD